MKLTVTKKGFTFIETMVVLALFAVVAITLFSSLALGMKVWKRAAALTFTQRKSVLALERMSAELRRTARYSPVGFFGTKDGVEFANVFRDQILNISYAYNLEEKAVYRMSSSRQEMLNPGQNNTSRKAIAGLKDFNLSYYGYDNQTGNLTFFDSWNYTKSGIPSAVKVSLTLEDGTAFEKVVTIPIAQ